MTTRPTRAWIAAALLGALIPAAAAAERVVDYAIDEATAAAYATEQGVALAPLPARGPEHVSVMIDPAVDHAVVRVGIACSAWAVRNPASALFQRFLTAWDRDGAPGSGLPGSGTTMAVRIGRASTLSRCVNTGEIKSTCITRVAVDGSATRTGGEAQPFHVERELATKGIGACAGLTRGIGLVSRTTAAALIETLADQAGVTGSAPVAGQPARPGPAG